MPLRPRRQGPEDRLVPVFGLQHGVQVVGEQAVDLLGQRVVLVEAELRGAGPVLIGLYKLKPEAAHFGGRKVHVDRSAHCGFIGIVF